MIKHWFNHEYESCYHYKYIYYNINRFTAIKHRYKRFNISIPCLMLIIPFFMATQPQGRKEPFRPWPPCSHRWRMAKSIRRGILCDKYNIIIYNYILYYHYHYYYYYYYYYYHYYYVLYIIFILAVCWSSAKRSFL